MTLSKRSNGFYYLWYLDDSGVRRKVSTKCRLRSDALDFLRRFKEDDLERRTRVRRTSLSQFKESFLAHSRSFHSPSTTAIIASAFEQLVKATGDLPLHRVGVREVESFLAAKQAESSAWTARKYYTALGAGFQTAVSWGYIQSNPFRRISKPRPPDVIPVYFSKEAFKKFLSRIADVDHRELYLCAVSTGLRLGELTALEWSDVDFARSVILVQNKEAFSTKTRRNRTVPMAPAVHDLMVARKRRIRSGLVFPMEGRRMTKDEVSKRFKKYVISLGVDTRLHFHSLRHTFASWLAQDGVSLYAIQKLLGHSSGAVTQIYSHLQTEELHGVVARIEVPLN